MAKYRVTQGRTSLLEEEKEIPIVRNYDAIVAGGGSAGIGAAVAAGRLGAKTLLIERNSSLGGMSTGAMIPHFGAPSDSLSGYLKEVVDELLTLRAAQTGPFVPYDLEALKSIYLRDVLRAGADVLFYTWVVDAIVDGNQVEGVIVENKSGRQAILARVVIDATGDGDVAAFAGAKFQKGRPDGVMRPVTLIFRMGNVDMDKLSKYALAHPGQFMSDLTMSFAIPSEGKLRLAGFYDLVKTARERGELDPNCHYLRVESGDFEKKTVLVNTVRVYGIDGTNAWDLARAEIEARRQMELLVHFMKRDVPGFENAFLLESAPLIGVRETRHITGEYILTLHDILTGRHFDDVIVYTCAHLPKGKEMHSPDAREGADDDNVNRGETWPRVCHEIPYRSLVVKDVGNLLVAGRCISATHEADRHTRNTPPCVMMGQAAGTAAALASKHDVPPAHVNISLLQAGLQNQGVNLGRSISNVQAERAASA
jgi:ribulose 1,5-bisphosphate synthetase/thiazole synthase